MKAPTFNKLASVVVIPVWIMVFGLAFQMFPALGLTGSVCLCVAGIVVIPAMMLIPATLFRGVRLVGLSARRGVTYFWPVESSLNS